MIMPICGKNRTITETEVYLLIIAKVQFTRIFMYFLGTSCIFTFGTLRQVDTFNFQHNVYFLIFYHKKVSNLHYVVPILTESYSWKLSCHFMIYCSMTFQSKRL